MKRKTTPKLCLAEIVNVENLQFSFFDNVSDAIREVQKQTAKGFAQVGKIYHVRPNPLPAPGFEKYVVLTIKKIPSKTKSVRPFFQVVTP